MLAFVPVPATLAVTLIMSMTLSVAGAAAETTVPKALLLALRRATASLPLPVIVARTVVVSQTLAMAAAREFVCVDIVIAHTRTVVDVSVDAEGGSPRIRQTVANVARLVPNKVADARAARQVAKLAVVHLDL